MAASLPALGTMWRNKKTDRRAVVTSHWVDHGLVFYRYTSAAASRGHTGMVRCNETAMSVNRFVERFERA